MFGDRLKELREEKQLTQEELGKFLNVSRQAISSYESEDTEPSVNNLVKLADIFSVSLDYLLGRTKQKENFYINNELFLQILNNRHKKKFLLEICKNLNDYDLIIKQK